MRSGKVDRVGAVEIEEIVARALRNRFSNDPARKVRALINDHVKRVVVRLDKLVIELNRGPADSQSASQIEVPWAKTTPTRRREILLPAERANGAARPIRSETRALLITRIAKGRRWLRELIGDPKTSAESIAAREGCTTRKVNMTISLAFLAPDLVKAAIEGHLPYGLDSNQSLLRAHLTPGNGFFEAETKSIKMPCILRNPMQRLKRGIESPRIRRLSPVSRKISALQEYVVADAVGVEPVSIPVIPC